MPDPEVATSDYEHFASIPWCARHLRGSRIITGQPASRVSKSNGEDSLFSQTLRTQYTILAMLEFYEDPISPTDPVDSINTFLTLGSGLNGHPDICHGGIVAAIMDEVLGLLIPINQQRGFLPERPYFTAYLNTTFVRPVPTCATILARARAVKVEGRKYILEGRIEDGDGNVLARAEAMFVFLRSKL